MWKLEKIFEDRKFSIYYRDIKNFKTLMWKLMKIFEDRKLSFYYRDIENFKTYLIRWCKASGFTFHGKHSFLLRGADVFSFFCAVYRLLDPKSKYHLILICILQMFTLSTTAAYIIPSVLNTRINLSWKHFLLQWKQFLMFSHFVYLATLEKMSLQL